MAQHCPALRQHEEVDKPSLRTRRGVRFDSSVAADDFHQQENIARKTVREVVWQAVDNNPK